MNAKTGLLLVFLLCYSSLHSQENPAVTYIQHVSIDYSEPDIVYAASRGQGLFKSTDGGESWVLKCDAAENRHFNVVVPDPQNPERVFAGGQASGLLLSDDKGETWRQIGLDSLTINDISIDRNNPRRVFVLAGPGVYSNRNIDTEEWICCFNHAQYIRDTMGFVQPERTLRFGPGPAMPEGMDEERWAALRERFRRFGGYGRFKKLAVSPLRPNTIIVAANREGGLFRSDDGGASWRHETLSGIYRRVDVVYFHPTDPDIIYVGTHHQGVFKTFNFGESWVPLSDGLEPQIRSPYYGAYLISGFGPDPTNPDIFYSGSDFSNWKSVDGGENWSELDRTLTCEFVRGMAVDPVRPNIVYAGSNIGMYKSTDSGASWRAVNKGFQEIVPEKTFRVQADGEEFQFAFSKRYPYVFRQSPGEQWVAMSWVLPDLGVNAAEDLYFDDARKELVLVTDIGRMVSRDYGFRWAGETPPIAYDYAKSEMKELTLENPDFRNNYVFAVQLNGDVFFDDSLVDAMYRRPPYISLQLVEAGYPYNKTVPAWSMNIDDCLSATVEIPKSAVDPGKRYYLYAEVRDFQKNYKTAFSEVAFGDRGIVPVSMELQEGFCLKKYK